MPIPSLIRSTCRGLAAALGLAWLAGCSTPGSAGERVLGLLTPYRADVVQGNVVTREQLAAVKTGQSRDQVRQVLGAPLLVDPFHIDRWDYVFLIRRQGTEPQRRSLVINFKNDQVSSIEAPELPSENEFVASISRAPVIDRPHKLALSDEERAALPVPPPRAVTAAAAVPQGAVRAYPPLETP